MPLDLLVAWMMIFLRSIGLLVLLPTIGNHPIPVNVRAAFSAMLATLLYGIVPHGNPILGGLVPVAIAAAKETLFGLVLGFVARMIFYGVELAGRLVTQEIGLTAAPGIDAPTPTSEPLAATIASLATVVFFLTGGHLGILSAFARSFDLSPAGIPTYSDVALESMIMNSGHVLELGFRMAAPFIAMDFLITLGFSVLGRAVPRMSVFVLSYPVKMLVGCSLLASSGALFVRYLTPEFQNLPFRILELVGRPR